MNVYKYICLQNEFVLNIFLLSDIIDTNILIFPPHFPLPKGEKKKEGNAKKESKKEVKVEPKVEPEPEPEDMISTVKSRRLMSMQAKKEKEELDRQNKGKI